MYVTQTKLLLIEYGHTGSFFLRTHCSWSLLWQMTTYCTGSLYHIAVDLSKIDQIQNQNKTHTHMSLYLNFVFSFSLPTFFGFAFAFQSFSVATIVRLLSLFILFDKASNTEIWNPKKWTELTFNALIQILKKEQR